MAFGYGDLVFFVLVVVFLGFRLFSVLGKRESDEDIENFKNFGARTGNSAKPENEKIVEFKLSKKSETNIEEVEIKDPFEGLTFSDESVKDDIKVLMKKDLSFDPQSFVEGAKHAMGMILESYSKNDHETLKMLLSEAIYSKFEQKIEKLESKKFNNEITLVSVSVEEILEAKLMTNVAKIRLKFQSEQINYTKDENGEIVDGSTNAIDIVDDQWLFERNIKSSNPNWQITEI